MNIDFLQALQKKILSSINVSMPGIIESYDFKTQKANIKIDSKIKEDDTSFTEYPVISGVPVVMPSSGGAYITMPVKAGDSCIVLFADKDITNWLTGMSNQKPETKRTHHLSDAVAILGLKQFNKANLIENNEDLNIFYSGTTIKIKQNGDVEIDSKNHLKISSKTAEINVENATNINCKDVTLKASGDVKLEASNLNLKGNLKIEGKTEITDGLKVTGDVNATGDIKAGIVSLKNHTHAYVEPIPGISPPTVKPGTTGTAGTAL
jgi:phage baseplate assembly protein gpV